jgi:hypothetical protein
VPAELADGKLDLVTLMFNYHDLGFLNVDRAAHEQGGVQGAEARRQSTSSPTIPAGPAPASPNRARCTASRKRSCARKSKRRVSSWRRRQLPAQSQRSARQEHPDPPQPKDEFVLKFVKP